MEAGLDELADLERELRAFRRLLEAALRSEAELGERLAAAERELTTARKSCELLAEENAQLAALFHDKLATICAFAGEFQKNLHDAFSFQKSKQELFRSMKELTEKNLRAEKEARRLGGLLAEREEEACGLRALLEKADGGLAREMEELCRRFSDFVAASLENELRRKLDAAEGKLREREAEALELAQRLNQKSVELDLLRVDYKVLLGAQAPAPAVALPASPRTSKKHAADEDRRSTHQLALERMQKSDAPKRRRNSKKRQRTDNFYDYF